MQVAVKMPHTETEFKVEGDVPEELLVYLKNNYSDHLEITEDDDILVDAFETDWYKNVKKEMHGGDAVKIYRKNKEWTQTQLAMKTTGVNKQGVSDIENGRRPISKKMAFRFSAVFNKPVQDFL